MAQIRRAQIETETNCAADKIFDLFKNNLTQLTKIFPQIFKSAKVLEGDGKSVNSVMHFTYVMPGNSKIMSMKLMIKAADNQSRSMTFKVMEGNLKDLYKSFEAKLTVTPKAGCSSSCMVKWCLEFEKINEDDPNPDPYLEVAAFVSKELGRHLNNKA